MVIICIELVLLILLAVISDIKTFKIKNIISLAFITTGLATNLAISGLKGFADSAAATILPFVLLFILYVLKMLGAGDIKLFCSIGAIGGTSFVLNTLAYSFLSGGVIALAIMLLRKNAKARALHFTAYVKACFLSCSLLPYTDFVEKSDGAKFRFSFAIACGTLITMLFSL